MKLICDPAGHVPVLLAKAVAGLRVCPGGHFVDATVGAGGHAEAILEASAPTGTVTAFDRDPASLASARERLARFGERVRFVQGNFDRFDERAGIGPGSLDGILADLGVSSPQLDQEERGFSFSRSGPLDMRMDPTQGPTALELLARSTEPEIEAWLRAAGEKRFARKLARRLFESAHDFKTTEDLSSAVCRWVPRRGKSHPATRVFLALRMAVNRELESLEEFLKRALPVLKPGGRLAVITFHSSEDRIVKWFGRRAAAEGSPHRGADCPRSSAEGAAEGSPHRGADCPRSSAEGAAEGLLKIITKKPLEPSDEEQRANPRSRSAKLRVFEKI